MAYKSEVCLPLMMYENHHHYWPYKYLRTEVGYTERLNLYFNGRLQEKRALFLKFVAGKTYALKSLERFS